MDLSGITIGPLFWIIVAAHFLPALIAIARLHHNMLAIVALNILLGWTVIGWIVAFIWSLTAKRTADG